MPETPVWPGLERSLGEGIGYPLQYSWASLVAQLVENPPAMRETCVWFLGWEDPLEKGKERLPTPVFWPGECPRGHKELDTTEQVSLHFSFLCSLCDAYGNKCRDGGWCLATRHLLGVGFFFLCIISCNLPNNVESGHCSALNRMIWWWWAASCSQPWLSPRRSPKEVLHQRKAN